METIKGTVTSLMGQWQQQQKNARHSDPREHLKKLLTKRELGHIKVDYFRQGVLGISVDSSSWLYTLGLKKLELLEGLKKNLPQIREIFLRTGEIK